MSDKTTVFPSGAAATVFTVPAEEIVPSQLDAATLASYGLPPRPSDAKLATEWDTMMAQPVRLIEPVFRRNERCVHGPVIKKPGLVQSDNWSGAVIASPFGSTFELVSSKWAIPLTAAVGPVGESHLSLWLGMDGAFPTSHDVFQAGVHAIAENGHATIYFAWWEWYPEVEIVIENFDVAPGQVMQCLLTVISNRSGSVFFKNVSAGRAVAFQVTAPPGILLVGDSAEWIAERPSIDNVFTTLADYNTASFVNVTAATHVGMTGMSVPVILNELSPTGPTFASLNGRLYLSWRGVDNNLLSIAVSTDNGRTFRNKYIATESSSDAPVLCAHNGNLFIAWKGVDNTRLSVANITLSGDNVTGLVNKVVLGETSPSSPTLASLAGRLYLSWRGVNNNRLSVAVSIDNGRSFGHKFIAGETSSDAPVLATHNGNLIVAWKGVDNPSLSVAQVTLSGDVITGLANKVVLSEISPTSPALASLANRLFLSWRGVDNNQLSVAYSLDDGRSFGHKFVAPETSSDAPSLCAHNGQMFVGWKGVDNPKLSVSTANVADETSTPIDLRSAFTEDMIDGTTIVSRAAIQSPTSAVCTYTGPHLPIVLPPAVLGETSPVSPTLASLNGRLYLSWRGVDNNQLSVAVSTDNGRTFRNKFVSPERSSDAPVLCAHNDNLIIAWKGVDNPSLTVATVTVSGDTITGLANRVVLGETSPASPTLGSIDGRLYLSWRGVDNNQLSVAVSTDNGRTFGHKFVSAERSSDAPVLCSHNGNLFVSWKGVDNPQLSVALVGRSGDTVTGLFNKVILNETSRVSPTLASLAGRLFLSWRGLDNNQLSVAYSVDVGRSFGSKFISTETSSDAPTFCGHGNDLFVAWKGVDNPRLSVAIVRI